MNRDQENALVTKCQHGDRQAMGDLVRQYERPVYNAVFRVLGDTDEAADVTQTAFLKAFERIDQFDPRFRFYSWIYRIALNEAIDQLKRSNRFETLAEPPVSADDRPPEELQRAQDSDVVQAALMELNEDLRTVLVLRYFTECSYSEIAEILELPGKTVKSRLFSARQRLKRHLVERGIDVT